jgi:hypothetical protein
MLRLIDVSLHLLHVYGDLEVPVYYSQIPGLSLLTFSSQDFLVQCQYFQSCGP